MYRFLKTVIKKFNEINIKMPHFIVISIYVYPFLLPNIKTFCNANNNQKDLCSDPIKLKCYFYI